MKSGQITAVGIDVSKGKSVVAVRRPGGEIVLPPFTVLHTTDGLNALTDKLRSVGGEMIISRQAYRRYLLGIPAIRGKDTGSFLLRTAKSW